MKTRVIVGAAIVAGVLGLVSVGVGAFVASDRHGRGERAVRAAAHQGQGGHGPDGADPGGMRGRGGPGGMRARGGPGLEAAATALGVSESDLRQALANGQTVADVAKSKNVDVQKVIDAVVADANKRIDQAVADGRLTQDQANQRKSEVTQRVTDFVNGKRPTKAPGTGSADGPAMAPEDGGPPSGPMN